MNIVNLKIILWKEKNYYVAQCLNNNISSFGKTKQEAIKNINEALSLYFEDEKEPIFINIENPELIESSLSYA